MPRVQYRKARKDYPDNGIKKGDMYYYTSLKLQRGGIVKRSLKPFKQSELTTSAFKGGWFCTQEAWNESAKMSEDITSAADSIREIGEECQNSLEAMPEGLQEGETGQMLQERIDACETCADALDTCAQEMDDLDEPNPFTELEPPEGDFNTDEEYEEALSDHQLKQDEYDEAMSEHESAHENIQSDADAALDEMP